MNEILWLFISIICSYGMAVAIVEKGDEWPIRPWKIRLRVLIRRRTWIFRYVNKKIEKVLYCTICCSFWTTLISDIVLMLISDFKYFLWPLSGFATLGLVWTIIEILNTMDKNSEYPL